MMGRRILIFKLLAFLIRNTIKLVTENFTLRRQSDYLS